MLEAGAICTWPRNPLLKDSKRRPVVIVSPLYGQRQTAQVVPLTSDLRSEGSLLRVKIAATTQTGLEQDSLAICEQTTCILVSLLSEPFGKIPTILLMEIRRACAFSLGLTPNQLRID
ncbi:type II toxin-antitoxin system PemK/MazF family toxin [Synechococcus elongatus IITB4]|uniref:type II toxin-antitoxin system PemK/MazF family toxin n=1 Tax=Synechococcus elongatus TaxID=32046 RepID=UPI0030D3A55F